MSLKVDVPKSERSRADGNAAFKRGKWVEAIGHYTNAIVYNPQDPVAYSNRAQAFLKIDKFNDAERDCTTVLALEGGRGSIKAYYRRGLARKGLGDVDGAIRDIEEVLRLDKNNEVAKTELAELVDTKSTLSKKVPRRPVSPNKLPPAPGPAPTPASTSTLTQNTGSSTDAALSAKTQRLDISSSAAESQSQKQSPSSFASLRSTRDGKKKAFASTSKSTSTPTSTSDARSETIPEPVTALNSTRTSGSTAAAAATTTTTTTTTTKAEPDPVAAIFGNLSTGAKVRPLLDGTPTSTSQTIKDSASGRKATTAPSQAESKSNSAPSLPTNLDPTSLSPGAGLLLLRHLSSSPAYNWALLCLYPAQNIAKILASLLEPDNLGLILLALAHGQGVSFNENDSGKDAKLRVKEILRGLKETKRWRMNVDMLSRSEREAGEWAWKECGGQGGFR